MEQLTEELRKLIDSSGASLVWTSVHRGQGIYAVRGPKGQPLLDGLGKTAAEQVVRVHNTGVLKLINLAGRIALGMSPLPPELNSVPNPNAEASENAATSPKPTMADKRRVVRQLLSTRPSFDIKGRDLHQPSGLYYHADIERPEQTEDGGWILVPTGGPPEWVPPWQCDSCGETHTTPICPNTTMRSGSTVKSRL